MKFEQMVGNETRLDSVGHSLWALHY